MKNTKGYDYIPKDKLVIPELNGIKKKELERDQTNV